MSNEEAANRLYAIKLARANELSVLKAERKGLDAKIKALEIAQKQKYGFEEDTLETLLKAEVLAAKCTCYFGVGLTGVYVHKDGWDTPGLIHMATEVPPVLQHHRDESYVFFRIRTL